MTEEKTTVKIIRIHPRIHRTSRLWFTPTMYIIAAFLLSWVLPFYYDKLFSYTSFFNLDSSELILSTIAGGMITFTSVVLSVAFLFLQFGSSMYTPRLAGMFFMKPAYRNSVGAFIGTFLYSLLVLLGLHFNIGKHALDLSMVLAVLWLLFSMIMLVRMICMVARLQVDSIIKDLGNRGQREIEKVYPDDYISGDDAELDDTLITKLPSLTEVVIYSGLPSSIRKINYPLLGRAAKRCGGILEMDHGPGDTVMDGAPILRVCGGKRPLNKRMAARAIEFHEQRSIDQDPRYVFRLLVDIGVRAISPAVNDPTTTVQTLDQIDNLLRMVGVRRLGQNTIQDASGNTLVVYPTTDWEDYLSLAIDEIRLYGASSIQVARRLQALLVDLMDTVPPVRKPAVDKQIRKLREMIKNSYALLDDQLIANETDRQGIGMTRELIDFTGLGGKIQKDK